MRARRAKINRTERRAVGYIRVSTEDQATNGVSLDAQRVRIDAYAVAMGVDVSEVIVDAGASAKSLERPGLARILDGVRSGEIGTVVVVKLDRLTRSTRDLADLLDLFARTDAALVSVGESLDTSSAAGRMVVNMLGVVAQWEREVIAERTASALAHKRASGMVYGSTPFGFQREGARLVADDAQQAALAEMRTLDAAGASYREIARMLEAQAVLTCNGRTRWYASSVRSVLR
ncbi:MAG: recombinase family protein, partial [Vulcanimicrobiaceae bacterium]